MNPDIHSWAEGYLALRDHAISARGVVELDSGVRWPRTTGDDVVNIAAFFDPSVRDAATPGLLRRWRAALDAIKHEALVAPTLTYAENHEFWKAVALASIALDDNAMPIPHAVSWHRLLGSISQHAPRNASPESAPPFGPFPGVTAFEDIYLAEYKLLGQLRGSDVMKPPLGFAGVDKPIPHTTNADVLQLAAYWGAQLGAAKRIMGTDAVTTLWHTAMLDVDKLARSGKPTDVYPKNNEFWRTLGNISVHVAVAAEAPTSWDIAKDTATHLPDTLERAAGAAASAIADAGHVVKEGVIAALKKPLYLGGGLVALYLLTRRHGGD
ncbi:MAG TPA: hypothetical protein VGG74_01540 [Kofleriaceae bacterium]|jgi:hypothetical protein